MQPPAAPPQKGSGLKAYLTFLAWAGGIALFLCSVTFIGQTAMQGQSTPRRVLIPTSTPAPPTATPLSTQTFEDLLAHPVAIPYKALARNPEKYKGAVLTIKGYVTYVYGEDRTWEIGVTQGNTSYRWENTVLLICMECPEPRVGDQINRLAIGLGYNTNYDGVDLPVVWEVVRE